MTDPDHEALERAASTAKDRLVASLEQLDSRAKTIAHSAAETTRAGALGAAGVVLFWLAASVAGRARHIDRPRSRSAAFASGVLKLGAVALVFAGARTWAFAAQRARLAHAGSSTPQLRRVGGAVVSGVREQVDVTPVTAATNNPGDGTQNASLPAAVAPHATVEARDHHD
jgi:hypothetical protein